MPQGSEFQTAEESKYICVDSANRDY